MHKLKWKEGRYSSDCYMADFKNRDITLTFCVDLYTNKQWSSSITKASIINPHYVEFCISTTEDSAKRICQKLADIITISNKKI